MVKIESHIICDFCNVTYGDNEVDRKKSGIVLRRQAADIEGWRHIGSKDYCKCCLEKHERSKSERKARVSTV
jgi:hypothetical protein